MLAGDSSADEIVLRCAQLTGRRWRWLQPLVERYLKKFDRQVRPRHGEVVQFLNADEHLRDALHRYSAELRIESWVHSSQKMQPVAAARNWNLPAIESVGALAEWLRLDLAELEWFADLKGLLRKTGGARLSHYNYRILSKNYNSIRLIEAPKDHLKQIQRQILSEILNRIPSHDAAYGFVAGRSIQSFAAPHVGQQIVLRMDLEDFFPSICGARVQALFRTAGYPEAVADLLGGICTATAPTEIWRELRASADRTLLQYARELYTRPHLPQGAPSSPSLANLCAYRVDCRLSGLAQSVGARYTRYADDLAFSGDERLAARIERFAAQVASVLREEGFAVHHRKTRIMRQGVRQYLAGLVTNRRLNVVRADFDRLKAILNNCVRYGAVTQNREGYPNFQAHLAGRIAFMGSVNPGKGERLRKIFQQILWPPSGGL